MPTEFSWKNERDHAIYAVDWSLPAPRAVVGLIHGLGEHCRRYDGLAEFFNQNGIAVIGFDQQGFGRSEGKRGYAVAWKEYVDETAQLLLTIHRRYPGKPVFLYGHSMGGQVLLHYLIRRTPDIEGAIVSAPHITLNFTPNPVKVAAGKLLRKLRPSLALDNGLDEGLLSRSPEIGPAYVADPHNHSQLSAQIGIDNLERAEFLNSYAGGLNLPVLLMHGTADGITGHAGSEAFAQRNPTHVTFKSWPGLYHELHFEPEKQEVMQFVLNWLDEKLS